MWPELLKAKKNVKEIEQEIDLLLKMHNSFTKIEIARNGDTLVADFEESLDAIKEELNDFAMHMKNHRNYLYSKSNFMKRHYSQKN